MKKTIITMVVNSLFALVLILSFTGCQSTQSASSNHTYLPSEISSIDISCPSWSVELNTTDDDVITVGLIGSAENLNIENRDGVLTFTQSKNPPKISISKNIITIYIPSQFPNLILSDKESDVILENLTFETSDIVVGSGNLSLNNFNSNSLSVSLQSGDINLDNCTSDSLSAVNSVGDIYINNTVSNTYNISTTTGEIVINDFTECPSAKFETTSGDIGIHFFPQPKSLTLDIGGGTNDAMVKLDDINLNLENSTEQHSVIGLGENSLIASSVSGSIVINEHK